MRVLEKLWIGGLLLLICCAAPRQAFGYQQHPAVMRTGFLTGNDYRKLPYSEKISYISGVFDGFTNATLFGAPDSSIQTLMNCLPHVPQDQLEAMVSKYLSENPDKWGFPMSYLVFAALPKACWSK